MNHPAGGQCDADRASARRRHGRLDFSRVALLRAASNFDQEYPGETPAESLASKSGGYAPSLINAYRVGLKLTAAIVGDFDAWKDGPPSK